MNVVCCCCLSGCLWNRIGYLVLVDLPPAYSSQGETCGRTQLLHIYIFKLASPLRKRCVCVCTCGNVSIHVCVMCLCEALYLFVHTLACACKRVAVCMRERECVRHIQGGLQGRCRVNSCLCYCFQWWWRCSLFPTHTHSQLHSIPTLAGAGEWWL